MNNFSQIINNKYTVIPYTLHIENLTQRKELKMKATDLNTKSDKELKQIKQNFWIFTAY